MTITYSSEKEQQFWNENAAQYLNGILRGLEKESLRISPDGHIAQTPHPNSLGATLTNQYITTDYSEALLEFITPPTDQLHKPLDWLTDIHHFVYQNLDNELLWATSMPCVMGNELDIPLAYFGNSNSGRMKTIYREGLGHRYGRFMQTIAGVHYNFSLPDSLWQALQQLENSEQSLQDFKSERYMGMLRNFQRNSWIIPYLFGASPALCESFLNGRPTQLKTLVPGTRYGQYATSLRMSDLGYQNNVQSRLKVSTNSLDQYIKDLESAIRTEDPYYKSVGVKVDGNYKQLNANVLQIENEFYSNVRPKRTSQSGERPTKALRQRGVEYIEVRALDLNPLSSIGVTQEQLNFLDAFMLHSLMQDSPCITEREEAETKENFTRVVKEGRDPQLHLLKENKLISLKAMAQDLFSGFSVAATLLDQAYQTSDFSTTVEQQRSLIDHPEQTLSGQIVAAIEKRQDGFFPYAYELSEQYLNTFSKRPLNEEVNHLFRHEAEQSHEKKQTIEQQDSLSFEAFLASYFAD
jgi:glutamate--cysteine ligase